MVELELLVTVFCHMRMRTFLFFRHRAHMSGLKAVDGGVTLHAHLTTVASKGIAMIRDRSAHMKMACDS